MPAPRILRRKEPAQRRMHAQYVQRVHHHIGAKHAVGRVRITHIRFRVRTKAAHSRKCLRVLVQRAQPALGKERRR